jgi:hypothetical protein
MRSKYCDCGICEGLTIHKTHYPKGSDLPKYKCVGCGNVVDDCEEIPYNIPPDTTYVNVSRDDEIDQ